MSSSLNSFKQTNFTLPPIKLQKNIHDSLSSRVRPPSSQKHLSPTKNTPKIKLSEHNLSPKKYSEDLPLEINSAKNSDSGDQKVNPKKTNFQLLKDDDNNFQFSQGLNQKMFNLQSKSNRLIQKVLAIQQQIQKYAEVQQKQLRPIFNEAPSSPLLQTKSLLQRRQNAQEMENFQTQHNQNIRKMNILGRNKVKMIENLEAQIQNLEQKIMDPEKTKTQNIEQEKKQLDSKFVNYYKHKNDILKQSKSQKFSFKHLKHLSKPNKFDKSDCGDEVMQNFEGKQNQDNLQAQLKKLKEQFSSYQERTSKQLENYKERLNQNILEKEILKKELEKQKYEHLKEKIFNKNKPLKTCRMVSPQKSARDYAQEKFGQKTLRQSGINKLAFDLKLNEVKTNDEIESTVPEVLEFQKTQRPVEEEPQFKNLQELKDQVSMRYIEENEEIQGLQEKIKDMDEIIENLRNKLEKSHDHFIAETEELRNLLQEKQREFAELSDTNECNTKEIEDLKNEINDMNNYIFQCKEENEQQSEEIEEYKNVIEEFVEQVKNLRNELGQKINITDQLGQQIQEAENINKLCENQINQLEKENEELKKQIQRLQNQIKLKQAKQRYNEALLQKQKSKQSTQTSFNSQQSSKIKGQLVNSAINQTIKNLKQENQQKLDLQRIEFDKFLREKELRIQELSQNLDQVKNEITQKVDQEVNEGIRTFLRYRKHTNHLTHEMLKIVIHGKKIYIGDQFKNVQFDVTFRGIKIQNQKPAKVIACRTESSDGSNLSLRKLIDARFNSKYHSINADELPFKLQVSLKLIQLAIQMIQQETNSEALSKSSKSSKKLQSLHPQSIYAIQVSQSENSESKKNSEENTHEKVSKFEKNLTAYQFVYFMGNKTESKKDKNMIYLSPEVLLSMNQSEHSYCWTLGVIIDEFLNNRPFYTKIDEIVTRKDNYKCNVENFYEGKAAQGLEEILVKMLKKNFKERPSLNAVYDTFSKIMTQI